MISMGETIPISEGCSDRRIQDGKEIAVLCETWPNAVTGIFMPATTPT